MLVVDILAPEVVAILAPGEYSEAMTLVPVIAASVFFMFMYSYCSNIEFYYEKTGLAAVASVLAAVLNVILNAVFIPLFGYRAAGYTTLACYVALGAAHYIFSQRSCVQRLALLPSAPPPCGVSPSSSLRFLLSCRFFIRTPSSVTPYSASLSSRLSYSARKLSQRLRSSKVDESSSEARHLRVDHHRLA